MEGMERFHLLNKVSSLPRDEQEKLFKYLDSLFQLSLMIEDEFPKDTNDNIIHAISETGYLLAKMHEFAFGHLYKAQWHVDNSLLIKDFNDGKISFQAVTLSETIFNFLCYASAVCTENLGTSHSNKMLYEHGMSLLFSVHAWVREELNAFPEAASYLMEASKYFSRKESSENAHDARYQGGRDLYQEALAVARKEWENGSTLKHHQMKSFLKEYNPEGIKKPPFSRFDKTNGFSENGLLKRLKALAYEINPELVSGQKKSSL